MLIFVLVFPTKANNVAENFFSNLKRSTAAPELLPGQTSDNSKSLLSPSSTLRTIKPFRAIEPGGSTIDTTDSTSLGNNNKSATLSTNNIIDATNQERIKVGLPPLKINQQLITSAGYKTADMIQKQYFEHTSPSGITVSDLAQKAGYSYIIMGENLALGDFIDGNDVVAAWMNSPGHRANILNTHYTEIGVSAAKANYQGREVWFAVQHFGTPRSVCPYIDQNLKTAIDTINDNLKQRQAQIANEKALLETPNHSQSDEYKNAVNEFNKLVSEYNTALVISQDKIKEYNIQVSAFNQCLLQYQTVAEKG